MVMNNKGQVALIGLMVGIMIFMMAMIFIDPISDVITETRNNTQLDCSNSSITDGKKATCLIVDLILPYFIAVVIAVAGAYISARFTT
ncbi:hypothetical protein CMI37_01915 [Candidatus Pacearchaeota archaeon]|jgi:hypothetical protein|nr:hypothetical protein [Candidatus Pacearchaeota archaeon]|tara:strand:- start:3171 stop:3434 length:264 start_codon:yes stop_codon:yes gene_type:complete